MTTLLVIGAGQMGSGIAETAIWAGWQVYLTDMASDSLSRGVAGIEKRLLRRGEKNPADSTRVAEARQRLTPLPPGSAWPAVDLAVEAIIEEETAKRQLMETLDQALPDTAILASNTSSISITRLARATGRPDRVIGMHFMNPVPVMELVEVIEGAETSPETTRRVMAWAEELGKTPVPVKDYPGFIANRILMPMINEAIFALQEGVATPEAIDTIMKLGMRHPMGPLQLADFIGLDTCLAILEVLYRGFGDPKYRPAPLLRQMVDAGHWGRKTGRGFYTYPA